MDIMSKRGKLRSFTLWLIAAVMVILVFIPFLCALRISLAYAGTTYVPFAAPITLDNFKTLLFNTLFPRWMVNSAIISITVAITNTLFASMAGYALARGKFKGSGLLLTLTVFSMGIPYHLTIVFNFLLMYKLHLTNTFLSVIFPLAVDPFAIFLARQFILTIPPSYDEAARLDGCGELGVIFKIILPMSKPLLLILFVTEFMNAWNNFIIPLVMISKSDMKTVTVGIADFSYATLNVNWGVIMAGSLLGSVPTIALFALLSKRFIKSFFVGGVKG